jgi:hypothetical protein
MTGYDTDLIDQWLAEDLINPSTIHAISQRVVPHTSVAAMSRSSSPNAPPPLTIAIKSQSAITESEPKK